MRILTTEDFIDGRIPKKGDFMSALEQFEDECVTPFLGQGVIGGFSYGSVNRGDCNVASDIDYFMIISKEGHRVRVREAVRRVYDEKRVPVQTRVIHEDFARAGFYRLDDSFRQHLELSVEKYGFKRANPLEILATSGVPFKRALRESMIAYLTKLNNGYTNYPTNE